jgi:general stress protein 26
VVQLEATLVEFLRDNRRAFLFCRDGSGRPIGYAMQSIRCDLTSLYFSTYTKSPKVKHLRTNPAAACLIVGEGEGCNRAWASVRGTAEIFAPSLEQIDELISARPPDGRVPDRVVAGVRDRLTTGKRCFIRLVIDEVCAHAT